MSLVLDGFLCNQVGILVRSFVKSVFDNAILKHSTMGDNRFSRWSYA